MIAQDTVSQAFTAVAVMSSLFLTTYRVEAVTLFPTVLLITGLVMQFFFFQRVKTVDHLTEEATASSLASNTLIAMVGLGVGAFASTADGVTGSSVDLTGMDRLLYGVLMAVAEEQFFRGFITGFFLSMLPATTAIVASAGVFTVYHLAVYGTAPSALMYVFVGGAVLSWVAWRSGRMSPPIIAHVLNNVMAVMG